MEEDKSQILLWSVPECPYRITVLAPVINEVRILAVEAFYSVPRGGVEIGGVFFGVREPDAVHIRAHRQIRCEYATGPSFTLSVKDQIALSGLLDQTSSDPDLTGMVPVGWYHSHTRSEIFLSPPDLQFYSEFFPERWQIAMVLRPANLKPTRAGFFVRDRLGAVKSDRAIQEFNLEPPSFGMIALEGGAPAPFDPFPAPVEAFPLPMGPAGPVVSVPAPAATIAERVEAVAVAAAGTAQPAAVATPAPPPTPVALAPDPDVTAPVAQPIAQPETVVERTYKPMVPEPLPRADIGVPAFLAKSTPAPKRSKGWIWALLAIFLLCGAGGTAVLKWGKLYPPMDLGLETYDINGSFLIRWDRDSSAIRGATKATLEIQDGGEKIPIELSSADLAEGGYGYIRRTGQVAVHMKVEGSSTEEEYSNFNASRALGSRPGAPEKDAALAQALEEKERLKTELINESMQSLELRREITSLRKQLAEARTRKTGPQK